MRISGIGFSPYIYNTNTVSKQSLNKISAISDDLTKSKVDYSGLVSEESKEENPLRRGQSKDFVDIIASQMALGSYQRDKIAQSMNVTGAAENEPILKVENDSNAENSYSAYQMNKAINSYQNGLDLFA